LALERFHTASTHCCRFPHDKGRTAVDPLRTFGLAYDIETPAGPRLERVCLTRLDEGALNAAAKCGIWLGNGK